MRHTKAISLIKEFEGFREHAYLCPAGVWTYGYGYTIGIKEGMRIGEPDALKLLEKEVAMLALKIVDLVPEKYELNENQLCALTSLVYNIGIGAFKGSTCLKCLKEGKSISAGKEILKWHKANGKPLQGLIRRRIREFNLYEELV
jgi:lysozyme